MERPAGRAAPRSGGAPLRFAELDLPGAWIIDVEPSEDERGSFARTFCTEEFAAHGIDTRVAQTNVSVNPHRLTLRGLHLQGDPDGEGKLIRCSRGAAFDVLVDLRPTSPSFRSWVSIDLTAESMRGVYAPPGVAHGFLTRVAMTVISYQMTVPYVPAAALGVRWDDPALGIEWPEQPEVLSLRDASFADLEA